MKKIFVLLFTSLLMTSMFIACGSSSNGDNDSTTKKNIPGSSTQVDTKAKKLSSGCETSNIPGCSR